jgi:phage tail-like protein
MRLTKKYELAEILTACRFYVELKLDGSTESVDGYFAECKGLRYSQDAIEFNEVFPKQGQGPPSMVCCTKMPGNNSVSNITLRRGLTASEMLWQWISDVNSHQWVKKFRDGSLTIYRQDGTAGARFAFFHAWPVSYSVTDAIASGSELAFEEIELACEDLQRVSI